jgi:hypothetical protein
MCQKKQKISINKTQTLTTKFKI